MKRMMRSQRNLSGLEKHESKLRDKVKDTETKGKKRKEKEL